MALQINQRRSNISARLLATAVLVSVSVVLSGFTYQLALPGRKLSFPADHYSHPDFRTEWWYYTGHLATDSGGHYGYQVTFFRFGMRDRQKEMKEPALFTDLYMAHFALSDIAANKFIFRERINRGYGGKAGAATDRYAVWNEDWKVEGDGGNHMIQVKDRGTELRLRLKSLKPAVLHGRDGLSQKGEGEGRASYYYSLTRMESAGELRINGKTEKIRGTSWMDHEFGSSQLREDQVGWDWFSIQLDNQAELMLYLMRRKDGSIDSYSSGTLIKPDGTTRSLSSREFHIDILEHWKSPKSGANYPMKWKVAIPSEQIELEITPPFREQELITNRSTRVTYWEGAVAINGKFQTKPIMGQGYVEMTGYAGKLTI
ncbi:MAG: lipocalin-like domain-containing protein [Candidatus Binatia bacterium]